MTTSIRKFLLINLLLAITVTTTLTAIGNYYLDEKDIQEHLDIDMAISALSYEALLGNEVNLSKLKDIQSRLDQIPTEITKYFKKPLLDNQTPEHFLNKFSFQLLNKDGQVLLHSATSPKMNLPSNANGFIDKDVNHHTWRIFTTPNSIAKTQLVLAERYDTRRELSMLITQDDVYIMLLTFPLSGLLIWMIIGRGLDSLERVAEEVSNRAPSYLEPVNITNVPKEIKPVIDELNQLFQRLHEGFEREKRFAADAAHELRTPLAAIKAQAQIALNSSSIEEKNEALNKLISSVDRSTHVVQQLLTMSKIMPDSHSIHENQRVSLSQIAREIVATLVPSAIEKNIEIDFKDDLNSDVKILGNSTAIGILIRNLVDNAIRYGQENGEVTIHLYQEEKSIVCEVRDNGPGIPEALHSRVFERFFRVLGNKETGSGLGLGIVKQICDLHDATITLKSPEKGTGLVVSVYFKAI